MAVKAYEGVSECHSLSSLCDRFAWKNQGVLGKFHPKRKVRRELYQGLTLGKLALTNVLNNLLLWHSFLTHAKQTAACKWTYTVDQLARLHLQCWTKDTRTPIHVGKYRGVLDQKLESLEQRWRRRQRERQKSNRYKLAKQQFCTCITLFWSNGYFANKPFSPFSPSLHMLYNSWDKSNVTWYFRGQKSDKVANTST